MTRSPLVLLCAATVLLLNSADAKPQYVAKIPNGDGVSGVSALGHINPDGGGDRNQFGKDFSSNNHQWTEALCKLDSDGDGATNGEELGDPCCEWKAGAPIKAGTPTQPGKKDTFTATQLSAMKCASSSTASNNTATSTGSSTAATTKSSTVPTTTTTAPSSSASSTSVMTTAIMTFAVVFAALA